MCIRDSVYSDEALSSKVFIQFIALILRSRIYIALKEKMLKRPNYLTVPAALKELEKIVMIRQLDGVYRLDHAVTATQKTCLLYTSCLVLYFYFFFCGCLLLQT